MPSMAIIGAGPVLGAGFAGTSVAFPAESASDEMLHKALAEEGIRVA